MTGFRIEKRGYSSHPWRVVWPDGTELTRLGLVETETIKAIEALGVLAYDLHQRLVELTGGEAS